MNNLIRSILKTAVYFLDQTDRFTSDARSRVSDGLGRAADQVSDRVSDLREQAEEIFEGENNTMRHVLTFAAGVGVGIGAAILFAPASGQEIRSSISDKVHDIGDRVRDRFSSSANRDMTGTEGR